MVTFIWAKIYNRSYWSYRTSYESIFQLIIWYLIMEIICLSLA